MSKFARYLPIFVPVFLALSTLVLYSPVLDHSYVEYDDAAYVRVNADVQRGLSLPGLRYAFTTFDNANWHPLTWLSLQLDAQLFGKYVPETQLYDVSKAAGLFKLTNVVWHIANTLLLYGWLYWVSRSLGLSAVVAGIFAWHPLHVESVAWIAERKDVLSTFFWLLCLLAYHAYVLKPSWQRYTGVVVSLVLGLLAKPMLVTLPCVLLLLDYWPLQRWPASKPTRLLVEKIPLFLLVLASSLVTVLAQKRGNAVVSLEAQPLWIRSANACQAYVLYLKQTAWPVDLCAFYPHPEERVQLLPVLGAGLVLLVLTWACWYARDRRYLLVGWLWFLGTLVPVVGLVQVGMQARADRYTYVPHIGLFIMLVWFSNDLLKRFVRTEPARLWIAVGLGVLVGGGLLRQTFTQIHSWRDDLSIWVQALRVNPHNFLAHNHLGGGYKRRRNFLTAEHHFRQSLTLDPNYAQAHDNLGSLLGQLGRYEEAKQFQERAIVLDPSSADAHSNLGVTYLLLGQFDKAEQCFREALHRDPNTTFHALRYRNLALSLAEQGLAEEAQRMYAHSLTVNSGWPNRAASEALVLAVSDEPTVRNPALAKLMIKQVQAVTDKTPPADLLAAQAALHSEQGEFEQAQKTIAAALKESTEAHPRRELFLTQKKAYEAGKTLAQFAKGR